MAETLNDRLESLIDVETMCGDIYDSMSEVYPEVRDFLRYLATVEKNHAITLIIAREFCKRGELPDDAVYFSLEDIKKTLKLAKEIKEKIKDKQLPLKEALDMALSLEESSCKSYFRDFISRGAGSDVMKRLKILAIDTDQHVEELRTFIKTLSPGKETPEQPR